MPGRARHLAPNPCYFDAIASESNAMNHGNRVNELTRLHVLRSQLRLGPGTQRGITTLLVAILLLLVLAVAISLAASVGVFEQRTTTNENRGKLAHQAAESAVGLATEFIKANTARLVSSADLTGTANDGWMMPTAPRWEPCTTAFTPTAPDIDPCLAEADATRRAQMYRYRPAAGPRLPYNAMLPAAAQVTAVGANGAFATTTRVYANLCRLDVAPATPVCSLDPEREGSLVMTVIGHSAIAGETAAAEVRETIASFRSIGGAGTVPIVASGTVDGLGNAQIVGNPNAGGWGVPASIWSACPVDIEEGAGQTPGPLCPAASGGGIGSVITCHLGDYLNGIPVEQLLTTCATTNTCGCSEQLSGHSGSARSESIDILDRDNNGGTLPDITYFPRYPYDNDTETLDDSLFEYIFAQDVVPETLNTAGTPSSPYVRQNCGPSSNQDCASFYLRGEAKLVLANCSTLGPTSSGLIYVTGNCALPNTDVGSPESPLVLVVDGAMNPGNGNFFGMLFVRSSTNSAQFTGNGNATFFGMVIVEGTVSVSGSVTFVYSQEIAEKINNSPDFTSFGRVPGTWLDANQAL